MNPGAARLHRLLLGWPSVVVAWISWLSVFGTEAPEIHWAFQPPRKPQIPSAAAGHESDHPVDRFLATRLSREKLAVSPPADRATWLRRATFDLHGLPPTSEELSAFLGDSRPGAYERVVDRLLASPRYGERWGRHWMDVVRYADTAGDNADYPVPEAFRYRDYIIAAFNADLPFDRFVQEQLAGDILAAEGKTTSYADGVVATGFLALSRRYGTGPFELWHLTLENTIETVGMAFLGLNLKCARCHDHKFDPLTMQDYYGLYGIFSSTEFPWAGSEEVQSKQFNRQRFVPLVAESEARPRIEAWERGMEDLKRRIVEAEKETPAEKAATGERDRRVAALKKTLRNLEKPGHPPDLPVAYAVRESGQPADAALQKRGEPSTPGAVVPRCVPAVLGGAESFAVPPGASGRREFARWLTRPDHPLTARVMVNRIWQHHFGSGLVVTPNNFGLRSEAPVHRELLDYLAVRFVESGWSIKAMHRLLMSSAAYQRSSAATPAALERDPANRWYGRFSRRRLDAESLRDAWLFVSGELELRQAGPHPFPGPEQWSWTQHTPFKERYETRGRTVYLMTQRFQKHPFLALFDGPDTNHSTEARRVSTVPQQALFVMNNGFLDDRASALAERVGRLGGVEEDRLRALVRVAWNREPEPSEVSRFLGWLARAKSVNRSVDAERAAWTSLARVVLSANEFFYVD